MFIIYIYTYQISCSVFRFGTYYMIWFCMHWPQNDVPDVAQDPQELTDQIERIQQLMEEEIARLPGELSTSDVEPDEMAMG